MKRLFFLLLFFTRLNAANAQQSYTISGIVTDDKDQPIPGATVFIADSRKVTASDKDGRFTFTQMQPGSYKVVVRMIGFEILQHSFMLQNNMRFRFKLNEDNVMLNTVNINGMSLAERKRLLAIFMDCFLGRSRNAAQCKILNMDAIKLQFDKKRNILTASSNDFLIIENKALGYRMKYLLSSFVYDRSEWGNNLISFDGTLFFEDMKGNTRQQRKWDEERVNAFLGSLPHYYRSLFSNELEENGFVTYIFPNPKALKNMMFKNPNMVLKYTQPVSGSLKKYIKEVDNNFKSFDLGLIKKDSTQIIIIYTLKKEPADFLEKGNIIGRPFKMPAGQATLVDATGDSLLIGRNGDINPSAGILLSGFWAWGQVSSFLPLDYEVPARMMPPKVKKKEEPTAATLSESTN